MIINCISGHGDVMFCEPIYRHFWNLDGVKPTVIIHDHQMFFKDYIESANFVPASQYPELRDNAEMTDTYIPLRFANPVLRGYDKHDWHDIENSMLDKYRLLGLSEDLWKTLDINLPESKGVNLAKLNNIFPATRFTLINENSQAGKVEIPRNFYFRVWWKMCEIPGYSVIDWWYIIWSAKQNHHVSTSTFYLMQAIKNKHPEWNAPCCIYPRPNIDGLRGISQLKPDFNLKRVE